MVKLKVTNFVLSIEVLINDKLALLLKVDSKKKRYFVGRSKVGLHKIDQKYLTTSKATKLFIKEVILPCKAYAFKIVSSKMKIKRYKS